MAITRLDASASVAAASMNYPVSAGTNRCLIVMFGVEDDTATQVTGVQYGGQAMQSAFNSITPDPGFIANVSCWYLLEAGLAAATNDTITPTYSGGTPDDEMIAAASYENVDQGGGAATVPDTATAESNEATPNPFTTIDLTEVDGGLIVAGVCCGNATSFTWAADMTEQEDIADLSSALGFADRLSTTNANVTIEATVASQNRATAGSARFAEHFGPAITDVTPDPVRMDQSSVTLTGSDFEAVQGAGEVSISDNITPGSGTIVDVTAAVTSWGDTSISLDMSTLSQSTLDALHTLGPGDGDRYFHVENDSAETSGGFAVHLMRPIAIALAASANIAASGENTTAQLAAPTGKTTGDFGGGRIQDDENPGDAINLGVDDYREDEWCLEAVPAALDGQTYQFRVLIDGQVIGTYTVDPRWTIDAGTDAIFLAGMNW